MPVCLFSPVVGCFCFGAALHLLPFCVGQCCRVRPPWQVPASGTLSRGCSWPRRWQVRGGGGMLPRCPLSVFLGQWPGLLGVCDCGFASALLRLRGPLGLWRGRSGRQARGLGDGAPSCPWSSGARDVARCAWEDWLFRSERTGRGNGQTPRRARRAARRVVRGRGPNAKRRWRFEM